MGVPATDPGHDEPLSVLGDAASIRAVFTDAAQRVAETPSGRSSTHRATSRTSAPVMLVVVGLVSVVPVLVGAIRAGLATTFIIAVAVALVAGYVALTLSGRIREVGASAAGLELRTRWRTRVVPRAELGAVLVAVGPFPDPITAGRFASGFVLDRQGELLARLPEQRWSGEQIVAIAADAGLPAVRLGAMVDERALIAAYPSAVPFVTRRPLVAVIAFIVLLTVTVFGVFALADLPTRRG